MSHRKNIITTPSDPTVALNIVNSLDIESEDHKVAPILATQASPRKNGRDLDSALDSNQH